MKKDALERFITENKDSFNDREPRNSVWQAVEKAIFGAREVNLWNSVSVWKAAAIFLAGVTVYLLASRPDAGRSSRAVAQEFSDIETYYSNQISEKVALISNEGPFADESFTQDIQKLEAMYTVLAEEMKKRPSEKVKDALVLNMLVRIDLLNQQIQKLEESRRTKVTPTI